MTCVHVLQVQALLLISSRVCVVCRLLRLDYREPEINHSSTVTHSQE